MAHNTAALIKQCADIIGPARVLARSGGMAPYQQDWRGRYQGAALAVLMPGSTQEVAALVKACAAMKVAIVPQGGAAVRNAMKNFSRKRTISNSACYTEEVPLADDPVLTQPYRITMSSK